MAGSAAGILGSLRILVDADTSRAQATLRKLGGIGGVVGGAIGTGLGIAGVAALKMGDDYKAATNAIRVGTGATGEALARLESDLNAVGGSVRESIGTTAQVLANLNTGLGLTDKPLQALTKQMVELARVTGKDAAGSTDSIIRLFGDWSVATENQAEALDKLYRTGQATGAQWDELARSAVEYGAPLRQLGYDYETSIALLGKWQKEGVNVEKVMGGMRIGLGRLLDQGVDVNDMAEVWQRQLQGIEDGTIGASRAIDLFGSRNAPDMIAAIKEGRFVLGDFVDEMVNTGDTITMAAQDTRTFADTVRESMNKVKLFVGPATDAFAGIAESMGNAIFLVPALAGALGNAIGRLWTKAAASRVGVAAAAAAGKVAGLAYAGASAVASKLMAVVAAMWAAAGGGRVAAAAAAAGTKAGLAFAGAAGGAGLIGAIATAVAAMSPLVIPVALKVVGDALENATKGAIGGTDDLFATTDTLKMGRELKKLEEQRLALAARIGAEYGERHTEAYAALRKEYDEVSAATDRLRSEYLRAMGQMEDGVVGVADRMNGLSEAAETAARDAASSVKNAGKGLWDSITNMGAAQVPAPNVAGPIRDEFRLATAEVARGFGSIKQALKNPPQIIPRADRLVNMAARMKKIMVQIRKATEADDPMAQRYWEKARAKQQQQIDRLKSKTTASTKAVQRAYKNAAGETAKAWEKSKNRTKTAAEKAKTATTNAAKAAKRGQVTQATAAADGTVTQLERVKAWFQSASLYGDGLGLMTTLADGIAAAAPAVIAAVDTILAEVKARTHGESPPPKGPLSNIDKGGKSVMMAWLGGAASAKGAAGKVGAMLAAAAAPGGVGVMPVAAMAGGGRMAGGGGDMHVHLHGNVYGGPAGLRQLSSEIENANRPVNRQRRLNNLSEG